MARRRMAKRRTRPQGQLIERNGRWSARYSDASGKRVQETLGRDLTPAEAQDKLNELLQEVKKQRRKKLEPVSFEAFARDYVDELDEIGERKRSTRAGYRLIVETHLVPWFGRRQLAAVERADVEAYITGKRKAGLSPTTINRHLNLLHKLYVVAAKREKARGNPVALVDRPQEPRRKWRILNPVEIGRVDRAFRALALAADDRAERGWIEQARVVFLVAVGIGLRRGEILGLRWRWVLLADPEGARLLVRETWVLGGPDTPKSEKGERTLALGPVLAGELFEHRGRSFFPGEDDRVFCSATGGPLDVSRYAQTFRMALERAEITDRVRPFHDQRHTSITNDALAGVSGTTLMARAGHSDFATTQLYIDLAGEVFREEAELAEARKFGHVSGTDSGTMSR